MADDRSNIILPALRLSKERRRKLTYELKHLPWIPLITIGIVVFAAVFAPLSLPIHPQNNRSRTNYYRLRGKKKAPANTFWVQTSWVETS